MPKKRRRQLPEATNRLVPYVRQSAAREGETDETSLSLEAQEARIRDWALAREYIVAETIRDHDLKGDDPDRPGLAELFRRCAPGDLVAVYNWDRFARRLLLQEQVIERLADAGIYVISITQPSDTLTRQIYGAISEDWNRRHSERLVSVLAERHKRGEHHGTTPFGYRRSIPSPMPLPDGTVRIVRRGPIEPDPENGPIVAELFRRRAAGDTLGELVQYLEAIGARTERGGLGWRAASVRWMLRNPVYAGAVRYHGAPDWIGAHLPLVDRELFDRVQRSLSGTRINRVARGSWCNGLVLHCCGEPMYLADRARSDKLGHHLSFSCRAAYEPAVLSCDQPRKHIAAAILEAAVHDALVADLGAIAPVEVVAERLAADFADREAHGVRERLERTRGRIVHQRERARALWLAGADSVEIWERDRGTFDAQLATIDA